jgi:hypothetical protein
MADEEGTAATPVSDAASNGASATDTTEQTGVYPVRTDGIVLKLCDFPTWFENRLSANLLCELNTIIILLETVRGQVNKMQRASSMLRDLYATVTVSPQVTRILKICDQIDTHAAQYGQEIPKLPGTSYLQDFAQKVKNRLKTIDDMASSSKLVRTDAFVVSSLSTFRSIIQQIVSTIELLERSHRQISIVTDYIDYIHVNVMDPINSLVQQNSNLSANQDTQQILSAAKGVNVAESTYREMCTVGVLIKAVTLKKEAEALSAAIDDMLTPLREVVKNKKVSDAFLKMDGVSWRQNLVNMLSFSIEEMLEHCRFR